MGRGQIASCAFRRPCAARRIASTCGFHPVRYSKNDRDALRNLGCCRPHAPFCELVNSARCPWRCDGLPEPAPFANRDACRHLYYVVAYQAVGMVLLPLKPLCKPRANKSREEILRERVRRSERELARLRKELKEQQKKGK